MSDRPRRERFGRLPLRASDAEISRALGDLRQLWSPTARGRAERRLEIAKARMTSAAEAAIRRDPDACQRATDALAELTAAQAELEALDRQEPER